MARPAHLRDLCLDCLELAQGDAPDAVWADSVAQRRAQPGALDDGACDCCGQVAPTLAATEAEIATARERIVDLTKEETSS